METLLTITTPSGQTLEGFPVTIDNVMVDIFDGRCDVTTFDDKMRNVTLHPGDKITIEILPD